MVGIDLNDLPHEFADYDGGHAYCTQAKPEKVPISIEGVGESPELRDDAIQDATGVKFCVAAASVTGDSNVAATQTTMPAPAVISPANTLLSNGEEVHLDETEVRSSPQEPFIGMEFETLEGVKAHYKAYSLRIGFSMKAKTSRRYGYTNVLEKQTFCCNKSGKPKINQEDVCDPVFEKISSDSEESGDGQDAGRKKASCSSYKSPCGLVKKRRREFIIPTNCQAKMTVKLQNNNKWVVTGVVLEHNHRLIDKPSLTKYLRCHQGIPPEEVEFLKVLHMCNMETGCMMIVMSDFYGQASIVPYTTKSISNMRTALRSAEADEGDLAETVAYFEEKQGEDPGFFFKVKKDGIGRAENLFWVDGRAREPYTKAYHDCISFD
ncbi:protein FAR-RED IMPAIRED RESPONSE 1-like [Hordeum vulgare subsp. vulgare]|uniref:protein FAR-RED IMPAIRED RESPONSE 1-like n=1 Tax=Hordeum vulgare subsp. vulgare TaxID=112509 RepID=UPI000B489696|nr:protein FAR-RED IMPAIRED RESPONSE 1-like [Hordeum vulgare subsp. vulgare]